MTAPTPIPDEAVEAACEAFYRVRNISPSAVAMREHMRAALEAAAPFMRQGERGGCPGCDHGWHGDTECETVVGYDHLNGDHECGCPGDGGEREHRASAWDEGWLSCYERGDQRLNPYRAAAEREGGAL